MKPTLITLITIFEAISTSASPLTARTATTKPSLICGKQGWDTGHESFESIDSGLSWYADCATACQSRPQCKSFGYIPSFDQGDCQLYDVALTSNFAADSSSPYYFYDVGCEAASKICDSEGYYQGPDWELLSTADTWAKPADQRSVSACYQSCKESEQCRSYAWTEYSCFLFGTPLTNNFEKSSDAYQEFYDMTCGDPGVSSSSTTTTKSTTTTSKAATKTSAATTTTTSKTTTKAPTTTTTTTTTATSKSTTTTKSSSTTTTTTTKPGPTTTTTPVKTSSPPSTTSKLPSTTTTTSKVSTSSSSTKTTSVASPLTTHIGIPISTTTKTISMTAY